MYLKAIEIIGFKSFADKVRLNFEPGVSCIVGPNGCGKSNVIDSVRWAIGEMSWKSLRSNSMVDIIFNGTKKRPPLNMAQVNMVFDNSTRKLPVDFNEVTVSRKIYRSGESEYFLNRVQCRLKDVREMFLDTGIGGEGYAIIDQGSVNQMLEASPEQRREMFEEVAGVSKYKAKRDEAARKLERVDMDIARLSDTLALIAEQIKKLDSEARKARLYQKYREELKESEIALSLESIKSHDAQIAGAMRELNPISKELEDIAASISAQEGEVAALDLNLTHKQKELNEFNEKIATAKYQIGLLEGAIQNCQNLTSEFTLQIKGSHAEEEISKKRLTELAPAIETLKQNLNEVEAEFAPLQTKYNQKYEQVRLNEENLRKAESEVEQAGFNLFNLSQKATELTGKIALEDSSLAHENNNLINLERNLQTHTAQLETLRAEMQETAQKLKEKEDAAAKLKEEQAQAEAKRGELAKQKQSLNDKSAAIRAQKASVNTQMEMIQTQGKNDPYWVGAKLIEESKINGLRGTLRKNIKFSQDIYLAVEEAFGKFLDSVICQNLAAAKEAIDLLLKHGKARGRFIILDAVPKPQNDKNLQNDAKEGGLKDKITYPAELSGLIDYLSASYSAKEGEVAGSFWLSGGAKDVKSPEAYWGEEETLKEELAKIQTAEEELSKAIITNIDETAKSDENISALRSKYQEAAIELNSLQNNLNTKTRSLADVEQSSQQIVKNKQAVQTRIEQRKQNAAKIKEELASVNTQHENAKKAAEEIKTKRSALQQEEAALKLEIEQANAKLYEVKIKKSNIELDLKSTQSEHNSLIEADKKRAEQTLKANEKIAALNEEKLTTEAKLTTQRDGLAALELAENKMRSDLNLLKTDFDAKNTLLNKNKTRVNELTLKAHDLENTLTNHRRQKTTIVNNLFENWNTTPEEALMKWGDKTVDYERVKMMRKRIETMGAVNMTAPEEYDALTERNNFLKKQIEDLENAKRDLKAAIAKINATTKENFKYTFEQVRTHFKNIYQVLFVGGEAELRLTDPENLLETGVEIIVQPPGKKLLTISALSGGEKALTAVSLLFAFFTHNPSPFCILDEADAPLDEANVERFVNLIKEFSKKTQFIVVTHNKRTMEAAQMLYGITMEENGVSKVLSLNLKEQDAKTQELVAAASN
ncbi:MAG: chromosome segregation protein SMC [Elusimicrobiota bacterium]|jgi:chromosome segregation protein|nr:chromosome segregation protein SMC [Elusimicrobiota bacterium]